MAPLPPAATRPAPRHFSMIRGFHLADAFTLGQTQRTASVVADSEIRCRVLHVNDLEHMAQQTPQIKILLLENLARDLAVKLRGATQWIAALA